jgi:hypothetical protein
VYGVPEAALASVEKEDKTQYFKCIGCALSGVDNHLTDIYQVNGTVYCLYHAKEIHGSVSTKVNSFHQPTTFNV